MSTLTNKRIVLGITGGIAAYKSAELARLLIERGATVHVVMTAAAQEFITPLTMQALTGNPVHTALLDPQAEAGMGHIQLARWADLILIAPASANFIARLAQGKGDDLLTTVCLASTAPIAIAPAMNQNMWQDNNTQRNLGSLEKDGKIIMGPADGLQACGDVGPGRMLEAVQIADLASKQFQQGELTGKQVVINAGPTREAIDPVRYLSNHSSGKMGYALAEAAVEAGARVTLISGPVHLAAPERVRLIKVTSAEEMYQHSLEQAAQCDIFIASAAVADYRPAEIEPRKLKKQPDHLILELVPNKDIVAAVASLDNKPYTVGFAAETNDLEDYARNKLVQKNLDLIVANDVSQKDIGFNSDDNAVILFWDNRQHHLEKASKRQLARQIIHFISQQPEKKPSNGSTTG